MKSCFHVTADVNTGALNVAVRVSFFGFPGGSNGKEFPCNDRRPGFDPWVGKIPWRRAWQPSPVCLPWGISMHRGVQWGLQSGGVSQSQTRLSSSTDVSFSILVDSEKERLWRFESVALKQIHYHVLTKTNCKIPLWVNFPGLSLCFFPCAKEMQVSLELGVIFSSFGGLLCNCLLFINMILISILIINVIN